jgi:hypothetical protein
VPAPGKHRIAASLPLLQSGVFYHLSTCLAFLFLQTSDIMSLAFDALG